MRRAYDEDSAEEAHVPSADVEQAVPEFVGKILTKRTPASKTKAIKCDNVQVEYRKFNKSDYVCVWKEAGYEENE